jgi:hypothetical protein
MTPLERLQADLDAVGERTAVVRLTDDTPPPDDAWVVDVRDPGDVVIYGSERGQLALYRRVADEQGAADVLRAVILHPPQPVRQLTPEEEQKALRRTAELQEEAQQRLAEARRQRPPED